MPPATEKGGGWIAAPGYPFILASVLLILLGLVLKWPWLTWPGLLGAAFFSYFFRDPERDLPPGPETVVAPADGKVVFVEDLREDRFLKGPARRVAIFMNVFDVHVNRAPVAGVVSQQVHRPGAYQAAFRHEAGSSNEQLATLLTREGGAVLVVQIAGLLARRIVSFVQPGTQLARGQRFGMICFGSRVDVYLPPACEVKVQVGDRVKAGSTVLARWWPEAA